MKKEIKLWLEQAKKDIDTAKFNFKGARFEASAFFCQQAAEKALKALYIKRFKKIKKVHDLVLLATELNLPEGLINFCKELTPAYTYTWYPDVVKIKEIKAVSKKLINYAQDLLKWIEEAL